MKSVHRSILIIGILLCLLAVGCDDLGEITDSLLPTGTTETTTTETSPTTTTATAEPTTTEPTSTETVTATSALGELTVHFIDVGQGDSILIDYGEIEIIIDAGDGSPDVVPYLTPLVDGALEVLIATHVHADHIGGLDEVLAAFDVEQIWQTNDTSTSQTYARYKDAVDNEGAAVHDARRGDIITAGTLTLTVLHPVTIGDDTNNNSIVVSLSFGDIDFLFTGDAEVESEEEMMVAADMPVPDIEILKVGHHASRTASSADFLSLTTPEVAIYMCALDNSYGHPHEETITALTNIGAQTYGTENFGTIVITTDGTSYTIQTEK